MAEEETTFCRYTEKWLLLWHPCGPTGRENMSRSNCWEVKKCGRQVGGVKVAELGVCPAASTKAANGFNGGVERWASLLARGGDVLRR